MAKRTKQSDSDEENKKAVNPAAGAGCLIAFASPFAVLGLILLGLVGRDLYRYSAVQSWTPTPATILDAELTTRYSTKGATTFQATARYRYQVNGKAYESRRVCLHAGSDNFGDFQRRRADELKKALSAGTPITAYVNQDNPSEAILFRDLRPGMLAIKALGGCLFGSVGVGLIAGALFGVRQLRREAKLKETFPHEPWRWHEKWSSGRLRVSSGPAWAALFFAAIWNAVSWPMFVLAMTDSDVTLLAILAVAIFPTVGTVLAGWAGYLWLQRWRWGVSEFEMAAAPGVLGGPLAGVIHASKRIDSEEGVTVRLACVRAVRAGKHTRDVTLWEEERTLVRNLTASDGARTLIPVQFVIPLDLPDSNAADVTWKLTATAKTSGVDYRSEFDVPVFKTAASSSDLSAVVVDDGKLFASITLASIADGSRAELEEDFPDRKVLVFPMGRHRAMSAFLLLFATVWIAVCVGLFSSDAPRFFPWVLTAFALLFLPVVIWTVLERTRLEFGARGVKYARRIAGFGRECIIAPEAVAAVTAIKSGMTYGDTAYWNVELRDRSGIRHTLATAIPRRQLAERLATEIATTVGISETRSSSKGSRMSLESELPAELRGE